MESEAMTLEIKKIPTQHRIWLGHNGIVTGIGFTVGLFNVETGKVDAPNTR